MAREKPGGGSLAGTWRREESSAEDIVVHPRRTSGKPISIADAMIATARLQFEAGERDRRARIEEAKLAQQERLNEAKTRQQVADRVRQDRLDEEDRARQDRQEEAKIRQLEADCAREDRLFKVEVARSHHLAQLESQQHGRAIQLTKLEMELAKMQ